MLAHLMFIENGLFLFPIKNNHIATLDFYNSVQEKNTTIECKMVFGDQEVNIYHNMPVKCIIQLNTPEDYNGQENFNIKDGDRIIGYGTIIKK